MQLGSEFKMSERMTIIIDSFDGYSDVWPYFFEVFNKYWENCDYDVVLVTNYKQFGDVKTITTGLEIDWVNRTLKAIECINTRYVMLLLEDYFLSRCLDNDMIENYLDFMCSNDCKYLRLVEFPKSRFDDNKDNTYIPIYEDEEYGINLQASIWDRNYLIGLLKSIKTGSAWSFEVELLKKAKEAPNKPLIGCYTLRGNPLGFHNGILKGKWFSKEILFYKKRGIVINYQPRGKLSMIESFKYSFVQFVKNHVSYKTRKTIKKFLTKFGFKFVSDI